MAWNGNNADIVRPGLAEIQMVLGGTLTDISAMVVASQFAVGINLLSFYLSRGYPKQWEKFPLARMVVG